jgi:hypothetical protein
MSSVLDMLTNELPPTATHARRAYIWQPDGPGAGVLTTTLQRSRRAGAKQDVDTYSVQEHMGHGMPGRVFLLLNLTDPGQPDVYETFVADDPRLSGCSCKAGSCRVPVCKHRDALADIIDLGGI